MISIVIPCYSMNGKGSQFLARNLNALIEQSFQDFEVIIPDNSDDDSIGKTAMLYHLSLNIKYFKNPRKGISANTNEGIKHATGEYIKFIYQDDYLTDKDSLKRIVEAMNGMWLITGSSNNLKPYYTGDIHQGNNKLGSPSALTIKNDNSLLFDENLGWLLDCDYYKRMYMKYEDPIILDGDYVTIGVHKAQTTNLIKDESKLKEVYYLREKYA